MALQGSFKVNFGEMFPFGCSVVSSVRASNDYERSTRENPVQAREKDTGLLLWEVDVMDFDPDARERTFKVKIAAEVQPVPPEALTGTPVRPVVLENLQVTPWIKDRETNRPKLAYSLRASGMSAPRRGEQNKAA